MEKRIKIENLVIYEDEGLIAVNKPSGLLSIPDREGNSSLKNLLQEKYGPIFTVHRLDRDTSGLIVFARNEAVHKHLSQQFENRETTKIYTGLVLGVPAQKQGVVDKPIGEHPVKKGTMTVMAKGKESVTEFEVVESFRFFSLMRFRILTGRTHQIRVHMKHLGHPIVCDEVYGDGKPVWISSLKNNYKLSRSADEETPILSRLALHATRLAFKGINGEDYNLEAPLSKDLRALLNQLQKVKR